MLPKRRFKPPKLSVIFLSKLEFFDIKNFPADTDDTPSVFFVDNLPNTFSMSNSRSRVSDCSSCQRKVKLK